MVPMVRHLDVSYTPLTTTASGRGALYTMAEQRLRTGKPFICDTCTCGTRCVTSSTNYKNTGAGTLNRPSYLVILFYVWRTFMDSATLTLFFRHSPHSAVEERGGTAKKSTGLGQRSEKNFFNSVVGPRNSVHSVHAFDVDRGVSTGDEA